MQYHLVLVNSYSLFLGGYLHIIIDYKNHSIDDGNSFNWALGFPLNFKDYSSHTFCISFRLFGKEINSIKLKIRIILKHLLTKIIFGILHQYSIKKVYIMHKMKVNKM